MLRAVWQELEPTNDPRRSVVLNNLAATEFQLGRLPEAETLYRRALAEGPGENPGAHATTMSNLGVLYRHLQRYQEAEALHLDALHLRQSLFGANSPEAGLSLLNLAQVYRSEAQLEDAERTARLAIEFLTGGGRRFENHLGTAIQILGTVFHMRHDFAEAEKLFRKEAALADSNGNPVFIANARAALGGVLLDEHRYEDARVLLAGASELWRTNVGEEHPEYAAMLNNLAQIAKLTERFGEADDLYRRALAIYKRTSGPMSEDYASTLGNMANLFVVQGKFSGAAKLYRESLPILESCLGPQHPAVIAGHAGLEEASVGQAQREQRVVVAAPNFQQR